MIGAASVSYADPLLLECKGQVNFTARVNPEAKTVTYVGKGGKSFELDKLDETTIEWTEADEYGISTNSLNRANGFYTETFVHYRDRRRDVTRAMCKQTTP